MNENVEVWKDIEGWEELYSISNTGKVFSKRTNKILEPILNSTGYYKVELSNGSVKKRISIHRLVAKHFVFNPNPDIFIIVNHKDENKLNNNANNLEWCTYKYNTNYGTAIERMKKSWESKSEEERRQIINKRLISFLNMDPKRRELMIEKLRKSSKAFWENMTEDEYIEHCTKIALGLSNRTPEEKALQYKRIIETWNNKDEATKEAFSKSQSKISKEFWDNKDEDYRKECGQKSKEIWDNKSEEEKQNFRDKMSTVNKQNWENKSDESKKEFSNIVKDIWKNKTPEQMKAFGELQTKLNKERFDALSEEEKEIQKEKMRQLGYMCSIMSQIKNNFTNLCSNPFNYNKIHDDECGDFIEPNNITTMCNFDNKKIFTVKSIKI